MKKLILLIFPVLMIWLCGCNDTLSRRKAKKLICNHDTYPRIETVIFPEKYFVSYQDNSGAWMPKAFYTGEPKYDNYNKGILQNYIDKGLLTLQEIEVNKGDGLLLVYMKVQITEKGKEYIVPYKENGAYPTIHCKTHEYEFGEVTGIKIYEEYKIAEVTYTEKLQNKTPFYNDQNQHIKEVKEKHIELQLYDDGWRIPEKR